MKYANVIIHINTNALKKPFTYFIPEYLRERVKVGSIVNIPFGKSNKLKKGYVVKLSDSLSFDVKKLKSIESVSDDISFDAELVEIAAFMEKRYFTSLSKSFKAVLPAKIETSHKKQKYVKVIKDDNFIIDYIKNNEDKPKFAKRIMVLKYLLKNPSVKLSTLLEEVNVSRSVVSSLETSRFVDFIESITLRIPYDSSKIARTENLEPNEQQKYAIKSVKKSMTDMKNDVFLLHGVTGSGKTEVYLQLIEEVLNAGKSAIFLIPEISLTHQTVKRVMARFGEVVGVIHSRLSAGEKYDQWKMAKEGKLKVIVGPRSAIFTPFLNIGIIIIDEEHESTYKSEQDPKYNAREVAIKRASYHKCPVLLGSATPLVDTYYKAKIGKYTLLNLSEKAIDDSLVNAEIVDMRAELKKGNKTIFSVALKNAIDEAINKKEQVILFLNSRGYSRFLSCRDCGYVAKCSHCDVPYRYHKKEKSLMCHYCQSTKKAFDICPKCGSNKVKDFGIGTEKVEQMVRESFANAKVLRMDVDTTSGKFGHDEILSAFENHEADILVGTQMVVKGHHFKNVTVVGVLSADLSLYISDFRASERTFQLITQVIGRAGRSGRVGRGIIQTYSPKHYSIESSKSEDYISFYNREIAFRKIGNYPPFTNILSILLSSKDERYIERLSIRLASYIKKGDERFEVLGPTKPTREKIADSYRRVIYVKSTDYDLLLKIIEYMRKIKIKEDYDKKAVITADINSTY